MEVARGFKPAASISQGLFMNETYRTWSMIPHHAFYTHFYMCFVFIYFRLGQGLPRNVTAPKMARNKINTCENTYKARYEARCFSELTTTRCSYQKRNFYVIRICT